MLKMAKKRARDVGEVEKPVAAPAVAALEHAVDGQGDRSLSLLISKALCGEPQGILCIALSPDEHHLAIARTTGSIQLYRIVLVAGVFHFVLLLSTGGQSNITVTGIEWAEDGSVLVASLLSGQILLFDPHTLGPVALHHRAGGAVRSMCRAGAHFLVANADGMWRQYSLHNGNRLELEQTAHKVADANRALSVHASTALKMAVGSDDAGNIVAWSLRFSEIREYNQLWVCKLPEGYANIVHVVAKHTAVAAGTSLGAVVFVHATAGVITNTFTHHKGPVTCLTEFAGVVYASGCHESLRCYKNEQQRWFPGEVKRRTHFHEATALAIGSKTGLFMSASRDGTLMFTNLHKLFTHPASYVDCSGQQFCFSNNILAHNSGKAIEAYTCNDANNLWLPLFRYQTKTKQHIRGLWCNSSFSFLAVAVDSKVTLIRVARESDLKVELHSLCCLETPNVNDVQIVGEHHAYIAAPNAVIYVDLQLGTSSTFEMSFTPLRLALSDGGDGGTLLAFGAGWKQALRIDGASGVIDAALSSSPEVSTALNVAALDNVIVSQQPETGVFAAESATADDLHTSLCVAPLDTKLFGCRGKYYFGTFNRGVLAATRGSKSWEMVRRCVVKAAFQRSSGELLVLERNLEETLEKLPPMWKVRRFGN